MGDVDALLAEQRAYYRARAAEYDDWWNRRGRYDRGEANTAAWDAEVADAHRRLDEFSPVGEVLELAAGTGNWTRRLVEHADHVTAVDASVETLAINRTKLGAAARRVDFIVADLFEWRPAARFDLVFMSFWLTHVPDDRFDAFWRLVDDALSPEGRIFIVDNCHPRHGAGAPNSPVRLSSDERAVTHYDGEVDLRAHVARRELADGRAFEIVKRYWEPDELSAHLRGLGWAVDAGRTGHFFLVAHGTRA